MLRFVLIVSALIVSCILLWRCDVPVCVLSHKRMQRLAMDVVSGLKRMPHIIQGTAQLKPYFCVFVCMLDGCGPRRLHSRSWAL